LAAHQQEAGQARLRFSWRGLAFIVFAMFVYVVDHFRYRRFFKPFVIMGVNAIAV